jgi:NTP pyrophosphatase (non-canonical NTP hydrolase)
MEKTETFEKLVFIVEHLERVFPNGNSPFQIITRLAEECGELASAVNHFEDVGVKRAKLGEPDPKELAKEVQDVMRCAIQIARHYKIEKELVASIAEHYEKALKPKN